MVFSVAVCYIKHLAMTRVAWELLCFQPLQTRGSDARCRQPRPAGGCVGQVCRVCVPRVPRVPRVRAYRDGERAGEIQGPPVTGRAWLPSLPCGVTYTQGFHPSFHPSQRQRIMRAPPAAQRARAQAGSGLPGLGKL